MVNDMNKNIPPPLVEVSELQVVFQGLGGLVRAVDGLSFHIQPNETVAIVGESGCGKSATALSILQLIDTSVGAIEQGSIHFEGRDLLSLRDDQMRAVRGRQIAMIFQEPMSSLNPVLTIGRQLTETLDRVDRRSGPSPKLQAIKALTQVGMASPEAQLGKYPHELSGGMRQRVMIAMALIHNPKLLIADEPTTALDVTIQAQVLDLMADVQQKTGTAILLITHDLGVVAEMAKRVVVMYAGRKIEEAETVELFDNPQHPYTRGLMAAGPQLGGSHQHGRPSRLKEIPGTVPVMRGDSVGCAFAPRCGNVLERCRREFPANTRSSRTHNFACFNPGEGQHERRK